MPNITLIGPGAIGGLVAGRLCQNPANEVTIAARTSFTELILETPDGPLKHTPRVLTDPSSAQPADWVLVATKAYDSGAAADWAKVALLAMAAFGTLFSIYLTFLEPFVIGATCAWCLTSAVVMTLLMLLAARPGFEALERVRAT